MSSTTDTGSPTAFNKHNETPAETIARLKAENKQLKKGLKSNLRMLGELEEMYQDERDEMEKKLEKERQDKKDLQAKLQAAEQQLADIQVKMACDAFDERGGHKPFWEFMKQMEEVSQLINTKIATAKDEARTAAQQEAEAAADMLTTTDDDDEDDDDGEEKKDGFSMALVATGAGAAAAATTTTALAVPKRRHTLMPTGGIRARQTPEPVDFDPQVMARRRGSVMTGMAKLKRGVIKINMVKNFNHKEKFQNWSQTLRRSDPRYQILSYFDNVAKKGADNLETIKEEAANKTGNEDRRVSSIFHLAGVFTVWRPTSLMSIRRMMIGEGVGKGLDIKGKSAKKGHLSAFVPFLQLHDERHKSMVRSIPIPAKVRVFYQTKEGRDHAQQILMAVSQEMDEGYEEAQETLERLQEQEEMGMIDIEDEKQMEEVDAQREEAYAKWMWELDPNDPTVEVIDDYAQTKGIYGLQVSQRVFFETYVMRGDTTREEGSIHDTGRRSEPAFQDMNMETLKKGASEERDDPNAPRPVVMQYTKDPDQIMDPRYLLIAYEELGGVCPVVSDFDCFLVGTRRINFNNPLPAEQLELMKWCIAQIEKILALEPSSETWTMRWLENLKQEYQKGFHVDLPKYGFADPKSYNIMAHAVDNLAKHGSVRHGAECFNYYFPQDLDDEFLVVTNNQENGPWVKYTKEGLLNFLSDKIDEGFMFPLNPKWVLCDPGWMKLWDKQMATDNATAKKALEAWYPPDSGVRETIERIHKTYPDAFQVRDDGQPYQMENKKYSPLRHAKEKGEEISSDTAMDMALLEVQHDRLLRKALKAVNAIIFSNRMRRMLSPDNIKQRASMRRSSATGSRVSRFSRGSQGSLSSIGDLGEDSHNSDADKIEAVPKEDNNSNSKGKENESSSNNNNKGKEDESNNGKNKENNDNSNSKNNGSASSSTITTTNKASNNNLNTASNSKAASSNTSRTTTTKAELKSNISKIAARATGRKHTVGSSNNGSNSNGKTKSASVVDDDAAEIDC